ncbi:MAG: protein-L-isoaspartate(D-aspartate) O-methyltransferase [Arenicella sp.]
MTSDRTRKRLLDQLRKMGIKDERVLGAMQQVPRHLFVDEALASRAYENSALPIGFGQTISQPYTVALMTATLFEHGRRANVLEIGTGCGYQTAILAQLSDQVISVECVSQLQRQARDRLYDMAVRNIKCLHGDGFAGNLDYAPYDAILAAAVSADVPDALLDQLAEGGRLVMPVTVAGEVSDSEHVKQQLIVIDKTSEGLERSVLENVSFVPRRFGVV